MIGNRLVEGLVEGSVVEYQGRLWHVGLVNNSRARLDPLTGRTVAVKDKAGAVDDTASKHEFTSYGKPVNVSPGSILRVVDAGGLGEAAATRFERLTRQHAAQGRATMGDDEAVIATTAVIEGVDDETAGDEAAGAAAGAVSAAPVPKVKRGRKPGATSGAGLKAKAAKAVKAAKPAKVTKPRQAAAEKAQSPCKCGCGDKTGGHFVPGHDARFKGWMLKIERGQMQPDELKKSVRDAYKWVKRGEGWATTTNYKGESHRGYDGKGE